MKTKSGKPKRTGTKVTGAKRAEKKRILVESRLKRISKSPVMTDHKRLSNKEAAKRRAKGKPTIKAPLLQIDSLLPDERRLAHEVLGYIVGTEKDKPESRVLMATYLLNEKKLRGKDYVTLEAVFGDLQDMNLVRKITHGCYVIKTALPVGELARQVWRLARRRRGDVFYVTQIQRPWAVRDQLGDLREWLIENV